MIDVEFTTYTPASLHSFSLLSSTSFHQWSRYMGLLVAREDPLLSMPCCLIGCLQRESFVYQHVTSPCHLGHLMLLLPCRVHFRAVCDKSLCVIHIAWQSISTSSFHSLLEWCHVCLSSIAVLSVAQPIELFMMCVCKEKIFFLRGGGGWLIINGLRLQWKRWTLNINDTNRGFTISAVRRGVLTLTTVKIEEEGVKRWSSHGRDVLINWDRVEEFIVKVKRRNRKVIEKKKRHESSGRERWKRRGVGVKERNLFKKKLKPGIYAMWLQSPAVMHRVVSQGQAISVVRLTCLMAVALKTALHTLAVGVGEHFNINVTSKRKFQ